MAGISLVMIILLGQAPARDAGELVRQLGSARHAEREAAAAALEAMGAAALPALRAAGESKDAELRNRAAAIVAKLEWREMSGASMVRLDVADRPLDAVVEEFGFPSPSRLAWHPDTPEAVRRRRVTIREPAPLPFWAAVDRLCQAGGLRYSPGSPGGPDTGTTQHRLFLAPGTWGGPRADDGPLRLEIVEIEHSRHVELDPGRPGDPTGRGMHMPPFGSRWEMFTIELRLVAEPRLFINQVGNTLIAEVVDDRGQSILPGPAPYLYHYGVGFGDARAGVPYFLNLKYPERPGVRIERLKLTIPVGVETVRPDRLEINLADALGKTVRHGLTSIDVLSAGADPHGHQVVKLKLRSDEVAPEQLLLRPDGKLAPSANRRVRPEVTPNVFQVLDQHGRQFPWRDGTVGSDPPTVPDVTAELMMWPEGGPAMPVTAGQGVVPPEDRETAFPAVLFHTEMTHGAILATFEFHDIPLP
jgi:hypothetical protein